MFLMILIGLACAIVFFALWATILVVIVRAFARPQRVTREDLYRASLINLYGTRSPDGNYWWDGAQWQPVRRIR